MMVPQGRTAPKGWQQFPTSGVRRSGKQFGLIGRGSDRLFLVHTFRWLNAQPSYKLYSWAGVNWHNRMIQFVRMYNFTVNFASVFFAVFSRVTRVLRSAGIRSNKVNTRAYERVHSRKLKAPQPGKEVVRGKSAPDIRTSWLYHLFRCRFDCNCIVLSFFLSPTFFLCISLSRGALVSWASDHQPRAFYGLY